MSSNPVVFGPHQWRQMHFQASRLDALLEYVGSDGYERLSEEEKKDYMEHIRVLHEYLINTTHFVPCMGCVMHFKEFENRDPVPSLDAEERKKQLKAEDLDEPFFKWSVRGHNHANVLTGKREMDYKEAKEMFEKQWRDFNETKELSLAQINRIEDHGKIKKLQEENRILKYIMWSTVAIAAIFFVLLFIIYVKR